MLCMYQKETNLMHVSYRFLLTIGWNCCLGLKPKHLDTKQQCEQQPWWSYCRSTLLLMCHLDVVDAAPRLSRGSQKILLAKSADLPFHEKYKNTLHSYSSSCIWSAVTCFLHSIFPPFVFHQKLGVKISVGLTTSQTFCLAKRAWVVVGLEFWYPNVWSVLSVYFNTCFWIDFFFEQVLWWIQKIDSRIYIFFEAKKWNDISSNNNGT